MYLKKALLLFLLFWGAGVGLAQQEAITITGYLSPTSSGSGPNYAICPEPWTRLVSDGTETGESEVWHCISANYTCYAYGGGGAGCSGGDRSIPDGWILPDASDTDSLREEIIEHVVDVCYLDSVRRSGTADVAGGEQSALELIKILNVEEIDGMVEAVLPLVAGQDRATRMAFYAVGADTCIQAARGADR